MSLNESQLSALKSLCTSAAEPWVVQDPNFGAIRCTPRVFGLLVDEPQSGFKKSIKRDARDLGINTLSDHIIQGIADEGHTIRDLVHSGLVSVRTWSTTIIGESAINAEYHITDEGAKMVGAIKLVHCSDHPKKQDS